MKIFFKWLGICFFFLFLIVFLKTYPSRTSAIHYVSGMLFLGGAAFVLALMFYYLEVKYIPSRKLKLQNRIIDLFGSYPLTDTVSRVKIGNVDVYIELKFDLHFSEHGGYSEMVGFHIPKHQIDNLKTKPAFKYRSESCNGIETYLIYETNSMRLKKAKKKIEQELLATLLSNRLL
jgi:hypothetical protein